MVEGLASRLAETGGSAEEWARLIGALGVLGEKLAQAILAGVPVITKPGTPTALPPAHSARARRPTPTAPAISIQSCWRGVLARRKTKTMLKGFEGGAVYLSEKNDKYYLILDEGTMAWILDEEDLPDCLVKIIEFDSVDERNDYIKQRSWD